MTARGIGVALALVVLLPVLLVNVQSVSAQGGGINWSAPTNLSNTPTSSNRPAIVADATGNVHVVWGEDIGGKAILGIPDQLNEPANTLVYTVWNGLTWSDPIDIIAVPGDSVAEFPSLAVDSEQVLHLVWTGMSTIYYSCAPALDAASAHAWTTPIAVGNSARTSWESAIAVDRQDTVHILYADRGGNAGVNYIRIADYGLGTTIPTLLSGPLTQDEVAFLYVSLKIDPKGRLHATWGTVREDGNGKALYYARSLDGGETWSKAFRLAWADEPGTLAEYASLGIAGDSELHLIYVYPRNMARQERISLDAGETWGMPHTIYPELEGIAGANIQVTDAEGNLHVLSNMRTHAQVAGLFYWLWLGDQWAPWQFAHIETETTGPGGHWTAATIRLGNEIHVLWNTNFCDQAGEIWHVSGIIPNVPAQTPVPVLRQGTVSPTSQESGQASNPSTDQISWEQAMTSTTTQTPVISTLPSGDLTRSPKPGLTILVSVMPALLLVIGVIIRHFSRQR